MTSFSLKHRAPIARPTDGVVMKSREQRAKYRACKAYVVLPTCALHGMFAGKAPHFFPIRAPSLVSLQVCRPRRMLVECNPLPYYKIVQVLPMI